jgi:hypothetical protein
VSKDTPIRIVVISVVDNTETCTHYDGYIGIERVPKKYDNMEVVKLREATDIKADYNGVCCTYNGIEICLKKRRSRL